MHRKLASAPAARPRAPGCRKTGGAMLVVIIAISGCAAVGPDYVQPAVPVQARWDQADVVAPASHTDAQYWASFDDPELLRVLQQAAANSPTLASAAAQVKAAEATLAGTTASGHPSVGLSTSRIYARPDLSSKLKGGNEGSTTLEALGQLSWELDFWGAQRRAEAASYASLQAAREALRASRVSLQASVATTYLNVRLLERRIQVARANLDQQRESLRIAEARYRLGAVSELDFRQSQTQYSQTRAQLPVLENSLGQYRRALAVLLGQTPDVGAGLVSPDAGLPKPPLNAALGEPHDLLRRRPDVRQAERLAAAESERIGQAQAALYPSLTLTGSFGYATTGGPESLFRAGNRTASFGPAISLPLFDRQRLTSAVAEQRSVFEQSIQAYRGQVLKAQQEVEDATHDIAADLRQLDDLRAAERAAIRSAELSSMQYRSGQTDYTTVTSAEQARLQTADASVQALGALLIAHVSQWRALGGLDPASE